MDNDIQRKIELTPIGRIELISDEVHAERVRQETLWGGDFDAKNTPNDWAAFIIAYVGKATYVGRESEYQPAKFRENMLKVAALAQAAVLQIDLHGKCADRHYDGLPRGGSK
jgi:hypothetical protein